MWYCVRRTTASRRISGYCVRWGLEERLQMFEIKGVFSLAIHTKLIKLEPDSEVCW